MRFKTCENCPENHFRQAARVSSSLPKPSHTGVHVCLNIHLFDCRTCLRAACHGECGREPVKWKGEWFFSRESQEGQSQGAAEEIKDTGRQQRRGRASVEAPDPEFDKKLAMVRSVGEECVDPELRNLLLKKPNFVLYDGFQPSGRMHIAQGVARR